MSSFCWWFFLKFCLKSYLCLLLSKNNKNTMYPSKKTVTFYYNCRFFADGFFWRSVWNLPFCPFFDQKTTKKTQQTLQKNRYVFRKLMFFWRRFPLKICLKSHLLLFFCCQKTTKKARCTLLKNLYVLWFLSFCYKGFFALILSKIWPFALFR